MILSKQKQISVFITLVSLMSGCGVADKLGKKDKTNDNSTPAVQSTKPVELPLADDGGFLKLTDFDAPTDHTLNVITDADMIASLNKNSRFYNQQPKGTATPSSGEDCQKAPDSAKWVANKVSAKYSYTLDNSECLKKQDSMYTYSKYSSVYKMYWYMTCVGGDLSELNGAKVSSSSSASSDSKDPTSTCQKFGMHIEMIEEKDTDGVDQAGVRVASKITSIMYKGAKTLGACNDTTTASKQPPRSDDCMDVFKNTIAMSASSSGTVLLEVKTYDLEKLSYKGLILDPSSDQNVWPDAGTISFQENNWTGTVTAAGSKVAPTYSMTNTTTNVVKGGSLTATPAD